MNRIHAYILTVEEESHPRLQNTYTQMVKLGFHFKIIKGVTPKEKSFFNSYSWIKNLLLFKRSLSEGEICCYVGHRKAWKELLEDGHSHALIFEDDFCIDDPERFRKNIDDCLSARNNGGIIKLFDFKPKDIAVRTTIGDTEIVAYKYPASGAVAYIVGRDAANALLKRRRFFRPVDEDLSHMWEFGIRVWSVHPNPVREISVDLGGSSLETERRAKKKQNVLRSLWGNFLQGWKLFCAKRYRLRMSVFPASEEMIEDSKEPRAHLDRTEDPADPLDENMERASSRLELYSLRQ